MVPCLALGTASTYGARSFPSRAVVAEGVQDRGITGTTSQYVIGQDCWASGSTRPRFSDGGYTGPIEKGYAVDRNAAKECRANIRDKQTGRHIAPLWWRSRSSEYSNTVTIESGQSYDLMLFARLDNEPLKYFVFASKSDAPDELMIPVEDAKFADTHEFAVKINYAYGRQQLSFDITMRKGFDGRLYFEGKHGGGSF